MQVGTTRIATKPEGKVDRHVLSVVIVTLSGSTLCPACLHHACVRLHTLTSPVAPQLQHSCANRVVSRLVATVASMLLPWYQSRKIFSDEPFAPIFQSSYNMFFGRKPNERPQAGRGQCTCSSGDPCRLLSLSPGGSKVELATCRHVCMCVGKAERGIVLRNNHMTDKPVGWQACTTASLCYTCEQAVASFPNADWSRDGLLLHSLMCSSNILLHRRFILIFWDKLPYDLHVSNEQPSVQQQPIQTPHIKKRDLIHKHVMQCQ